MLVLFTRCQHSRGAVLSRISAFVYHLWAACDNSAPAKWGRQTRLGCVRGLPEGSSCLGVVGNQKGRNCKFRYLVIMRTKYNVRRIKISLFENMIMVLNHSRLCLDRNKNTLCMSPYSPRKTHQIWNGAKRVLTLSTE